MISAGSALLFVATGLAAWLPAPGMADPSASPAPTAAKLVIEPSSSRLAGGTAKLAVNPLSRSGSNYVGDYRIKVIPYFFKNENGRLIIEVSEPKLQQMLEGGVTSFVGEAKANHSDLKHKITARATPAGRKSGALTFTVATDNGPLVFNTSYKIVPQ